MEVNYFVLQLASDVEDVLERLVKEIEQIQEDIAECDVNFLNLEEMKKNLSMALEVAEKIQRKEE